MKRAACAARGRSGIARPLGLQGARHLRHLPRVPGYERYARYHQELAQAANPLAYLAQQEEPPIAGSMTCRWRRSLPSMTIVPAMERGRKPEAVAWIHRSFAQDFYRSPPRLLLQEVGPNGQPIIDFVSYFSPDVPELRRYRLVRRLPQFQVLAAPEIPQR